MINNINKLQNLKALLPTAISNKVSLSWDNIGDHYSQSLLSRDESKIFASFESRGRENEFLASRWLIQQMVQHSPINPDDFVLHKDEWGKPYGTSDGCHFYISISHTDKKVMCGLSSEIPVGIDIEPKHRKVSAKLRKRMLNLDEHVLLTDVDDLRIWTIKEAIVKLQGRGLGSNLDECTISAQKNMLFTAKQNDGKKVKIYSFEHQHNWVAIAWNY